MALAMLATGGPTINETLSTVTAVRQTGVHACGVIIGRDDLENFAPKVVAKDADLNVVEFEGKQVESVGLIKMDFLGLSKTEVGKPSYFEGKIKPSDIINLL